MTPAARMQAAIDLLDAIIASADLMCERGAGRIGPVPVVVAVSRALVGTSAGLVDDPDSGRRPVALMPVPGLPDELAALGCSS